MCGIFGIITSNKVKFNKPILEKTITELALLSERRGKDSSGLTLFNSDDNSINVYKGNIPINQLIKNTQFNKNIDENINLFLTKKDAKFICFGHSRLVTNGSQLNQNNNQPVIKDGLVGVHNGIIVNTEPLWNKLPKSYKEFEIDTEVLLAMVRNFLNEENNTCKAVSNSIKSTIGTVSTALLFTDRNEFVLATNNGSIYITTDNKSYLIFASEAYVIQSVIKKINLKSSIKQIIANNGVLINFDKMVFNEFNLIKNTRTNSISITKKNSIVNVYNIKNTNNERSVIIDVENFSMDPANLVKKEILEYNIKRINKLKRCSKCILPETFPFIEFDFKGVCNYCNNYTTKNNKKDISKLQNLVKPYKRRNGQADCLVPLSGGRDSTYVLHYAQTVLDLKPITFTYDWGMVTDLARRNIARVCGKLGVENIIVAADIRKKRKYINDNISAWLKQPELGMIPLFMAGDKYFFKYANQIKKQNNIQLEIWGINFLENTDFKIGFAGVQPDWNKKMIYSMKLSRQLKLFGFVGRNLLQNRNYINSSIPDTIGSFISRYLNPRNDYYHFFDYHQWNESEIENILFDEYDWEIAKDLNSTWRIGDGTASFYNYIYFTVAGFSEFDTFRSNQIREGMITRNKALELVEEENIPRYESLRWYLEIIGMDYDDTIKTINNIPKLYNNNI